MTETKVCPVCGQTFARTYATPARQWAEKKYCSKACGAVNRARIRYTTGPRAPKRPRTTPRAPDEKPVCACGNPPTLLAWLWVWPDGQPVYGPLAICADCADLLLEDEPNTCLTPYVAQHYHQPKRSDAYEHA